MGLHEIGYTYKKLTSVPTESQTPNCQARYDDFLSYISDMDAHSIHFFDESSVIKTTSESMAAVKLEKSNRNSALCLKCDLYNKFITQYTWN